MYLSSLRLNNFHIWFLKRDGRASKYRKNKRFIVR